MTTERDEEIRRLEARLAELRAEASEETPSASIGGGAAPLAPENSKPVHSGFGKGVMVIAAVVVGLVLLQLAVAASDTGDRQKEAVAQASEDERSAAAAAEEAAAGAGSLAAEAEAAVAAAEAAESATAWNYSSREHGMGGEIREACVLASNMVHLDWPYTSQNARLCIRRHPEYGLDAILALPSGGQFVCTSYDGCIVKVRYDQGSPQSFSAAESADGASDVLFIVNASRFVNGLKSAETVRVQAAFYQNGNQIMEFPVAGFDAAKVN